MMKIYIRLFLACCFIFWAGIAAFATHNRAGEIVVESVGDCSSNTVRVTVITYTKTSSVPADRDSLLVCWGEGSPQFCEMVARTNGPGMPPQGEPLPNDIKRNFYVAFHTYSGPGHYTVSMTDPNRIGGLINVNPPGSENVLFYIETAFTLFNGLFEGCNSTPTLFQPPIDYACTGQIFIHNPNAYDPDGDSLTYELVAPLQGNGSPVPNYTYPQNVNGNNNCCLTLNRLTGDLEWSVPLVVGEYNIAMIIVSWRNSIPIDTTVRDMQILVFDCDMNHAPEIDSIAEICVVAGDVVEFEVTASDPDNGDKIRLTALGAPFEVATSPADDKEGWNPPAGQYQSNPFTKTFRWQTACEHIADLPYTVVFKAEDDFFLQNIQGSTGLATLRAVRIKVVGPPPLEVQVEPNADRMLVSWEKPYKCEDAEDDYFLAFSVWRKEGSNNFPLDTCDPGLAGKGYLQLGNTLGEANGRYQFEDENVERGHTYCYRILGVFAKKSATGQPYNKVESLASEEVCKQLRRDVPLLTNVSIEETSTNAGQILVRWTKPLAADLDTVLNHGPYRYELLRATGIGGSNFTSVATFAADQFWQLNETEFLDQGPGLDTRSNAYTYKIDFFVKNESEPVGNSPTASSVYLEIAPTDNQNNLSWKFEVPWSNYSYTIYRQNAATGWDSIAVTTDSVYFDSGLLNGREYCYYVRSEGSYEIDGVPSPLFNLSQENCATPIDNVAPCPTVLAVKNICDQNISCQEEEDLNNQLIWDNPMELCEKTDDVTGYRIYYAPTDVDALQLIASIDESGTTTFLHQPERGIAGCYAVTAVDTFLNESALSNIVCVDNCPNYTLPNAFTPNGDGKNDLYTPYPFCFIESIDITVFNRWGEAVFETKDANINWNGENRQGKELPAGTYYYTCRVFEQRVSGTVEAPALLKGYIDLIR